VSRRYRVPVQSHNFHVLARKGGRLWLAQIEWRPHIHPGTFIRAVWCARLDRCETDGRTAE